AVGVCIHRRERASPNFYARSALAPSRFRPGVKHASPPGQPRRGTGGGSKPPAGGAGPRGFLFFFSAPKSASGGGARTSLPAAGLARNCQSGQLLGIAAATAWTISFERLESPWRSFRREGTLPAEARAMALNQVTLDDKFDLAKSRIFVTGFQAIVRLCLMQKERDRRAGLNTAGYVTGYRGSPLGTLVQQFIRAQRSLDKYDIRFQAGINEDIAATAIWGSQQAELRGEGKFDGVFGLWYGKGLGVDRTGDVFRHANFAGTSKHGGVLALMGDDHTAESSTTAHQSEYHFIDVMIPILNPAGVQEILDYGLYGWAMSRF